jgi:hypothetical protein
MLVMRTTCVKCGAPLTAKQILMARMLWDGGVHQSKIYCDKCYETAEGKIICKPKKSIKTRAFAD